MKKILAAIVLFGMLGVSLPAQAAHSVTLNWTASTDSTTATPGTVSVFRALGACPATGLGTATYTALTTTALAGGPYIDTTVTAGSSYCYYIGATIGAATSGPSNTYSALIPIAPPTITVVVIQ